MPISHYPSGFPHGITIKGFPLFTVLQTTRGKVFYVDNNGCLSSDNNEGTDKYPLKTIQEAVGRCVNDRGDVILVAANHKEVITHTNTINIDKSGISIIGLGVQDARPMLSYETSDDAVLSVLAENVYFGDFILEGNISGLKTMITGDLLNLLAENCTFREGSAPGIKFVNIEGSADNKCDGVKFVHCEFLNKTPSVYESAAEFRTYDVVKPEFIDCNVFGYFTWAPLYNSLNFGGDIYDLLVDGGSWHNLEQYAHAIRTHHDQNGLITKNTNLRANRVGQPILTFNTGRFDNGDMMVFTSDLKGAPQILVTGTNITRDITGEFVIEDVIFETDATGLATATNIQLYRSNVVYGSEVFFEEAVSNLGPNSTVTLKTASIIGHKTVLQHDQAVRMRATVANATGGTVKVTLILRTVTDGSVNQQD